MNIYVLIMVSFMVILAIMGMFISKRVKSSDDWAVAGRSLGIIPCVGTYFATITSSAAMVSYVGYYYDLGWGGWWNWTGAAVTSLLAAAFFAAKLRRVGKITLPDYLEDRFGRTQSVLCSVLILFATIFLTCAQIIGAANVLIAASGWSMPVCIILISVLFICFTMFGGMLSVAWTDTLCATIIVIGLWIGALYLVGNIGGFGSLLHALNDIDPALLSPTAGGSMPITMIISWLCTWGFGNFGAPQFITRFYSAKDERTARLSQGYTGLVLLFFHIPLALFALAGLVLLPGITPQDQVSPTLIRDLLPVGLGGIMFAAILAACISTADSVLLLSATTASNDLYRKLVNPKADSATLLRFSKGATLIIGVAAALATIFISTAIMWIQTSMVTLMGSAMSVSVLVGLSWKRANKQGGLASCILGFCTGAAWYLLGQPFGLMPIIPAMIVGVAAIIVVSLITPPPPQSVMEQFFPEAKD